MWLWWQDRPSSVPLPDRLHSVATQKTAIRKRNGNLEDLTLGGMIIFKGLRREGRVNGHSRKAVQRTIKDRGRQTAGICWTIEYQVFKGNLLTVVLTLFARVPQFIATRNWGTLERFRVGSSTWESEKCPCSASLARRARYIYVYTHTHIC